MRDRKVLLRYGYVPATRYRSARRYSAGCRDSSRSEASLVASQPLHDRTSKMSEHRVNSCDFSGRAALLACDYLLLTVDKKSAEHSSYTCLMERIQAARRLLLQESFGVL